MVVPAEVRANALIPAAGVFALQVAAVDQVALAEPEGLAALEAATDQADQPGLAALEAAADQADQPGLAALEAVADQADQLGLAVAAALVAQEVRVEVVGLLAIALHSVHQAGQIIALELFTFLPLTIQNLIVLPAVLDLGQAHTVLWMELVLVFIAVLVALAVAVAQEDREDRAAHVFLMAQYVL